MSLSHGSFLLSNSRTLRRHFRIQLSISGPFCGQVVLMEDGSYRTFRNTGLAVDALVRMNKQNCFTFVKALYRTNDHTIGVFAVETRFRNNVSHFKPFQARPAGIRKIRSRRATLNRLQKFLSGNCTECEPETKLSGLFSAALHVNPTYTSPN